MDMGLFQELIDWFGELSPAWAFLFALPFIVALIGLIGSCLIKPKPPRDDAIRRLDAGSGRIDD